MYIIMRKKCALFNVALINMKAKQAYLKNK